MKRINITYSYEWIFSVVKDDQSESEQSDDTFSDTDDTDEDPVRLFQYLFREILKPTKIKTFFM